MNFEHLKKLKPGGQPIPSQELDWLESSFDSYYPKDVWFPYLFPTLQGHVLAEWPFAWYFPSLEIDLNKKTGEWHNVNLVTNQEEIITFNLSNPEDWLKVVEKIRKIEAED